MLIQKTAAKNYKLMQLQKNCPSAQFPVIAKMIRNSKQQKFSTNEAFPSKTV